MKNSLLQKLEQKAVKNNILLAGIFELTQRCNLNCRHCYVVRVNKKELNFQEIKNILHQLKDVGVMFILFTGGEVLLRDDFLKIIKVANKLKFSFKFFTNGTLLNPENVKKIADAFPLEVGISIYSHNKNIHDNITQVSGSFEKSIGALKLLREQNLNVKIKCPLMKLNINSIEEIKKLADNLGCNYHFSVTLVPKDDGNKLPLKLRCNENEIENAMLRAGNFNIKKRQNLMCGIGKTTFAISPWGDIYPCLQYKVNCGNLKRTKFSSIWNNSKILTKIRKIVPSDLVECYNCKDNIYCMRCFGIAHLEDGDFFGKSIFSCMQAEVLKKIDYENKTSSTS